MLGLSPLDGAYLQCTSPRGRSLQSGDPLGGFSRSRSALSNRRRACIRVRDLQVRLQPFLRVYERLGPCLGPRLRPRLGNRCAKGLGMVLA